jgi:hypothetical protein
MTQDQQITALEQRIAALEQSALRRQEHTDFRSFLLNQSGYIRFERLPELYDSNGNLISSGGTPEIELPEVPPVERFEWISPVNGTGTNVIAVDLGEDATIIDVAETGVIVGVGVVVSKYTATGGTADVFIDTTIDGGDTQPFQIVFGDIQWGKAMQIYVQVGATPQSGNVDGHSMFIPMGLSYGSHLTVAARSTELTTITGEYDLAFSVIRGKLVSA